MVFAIAGIVPQKPIVIYLNFLRDLATEFTSRVWLVDNDATIHMIDIFDIIVIPCSATQATLVIFQECSRCLRFNFHRSQ